MEGYGLTPLECYQYYVAVKTHFTGGYDFIKYGIKGIKESGYSGRKDKYYFEKIARKWTRNEIVPLLVSCLLKNPSIFSADLLESEAKESYLAFLNTRGKMFLTFKSDVVGLNEFIVDNGLVVSDLFKVEHGQHPITFRMYLQGLLSIETYVILNKYIKFFDVYDNKLKGDYVWEVIHRKKLMSYSPFVKVDRKYFNVLKENFYGNGKP